MNYTEHIAGEKQPLKQYCVRCGQLLWDGAYRTESFKPGKAVVADGNDTIWDPPPRNATINECVAKPAYTMLHPFEHAQNPTGPGRPKLKIQPEELRIGNWVCYCGRFSAEDPQLVRVASIGYGYNPAMVFDGVDIHASLSELSPIPLTPEVLERCGLEGKRYFEDNMLSWQVDGFWITEDYQIATTDSEGFYPIAISRPIKHLHQLQNAIHALTGQELEVKL